MRNRSSFRTLALATCSVAAVSLFASSGLAQAGDTCGSAPIVSDGSFPFDLNGATNDGTANCQFPTNGPDVWYRYTAAGNGLVTVSTCGNTTGDTMLAAYDGCGGAQIACLDDFCGLQTQISFNVTTGQTYAIRISQFNGGAGSTITGNVVITSNTGSGPLNDRCTGAIAIGVGSFPFDNSLAAADAEEGPAASCGFGGDGGSKDIFYRFTSPTSGNATIDTCGSFDTILQALTGCGGTELACNDDACGLSSRISFAVVSGGSYIIRLSGYQGASGAGNLNVSVSEGTTPGDFCATAFPAPGPGTYDFDTSNASIDAAANCAGNGSPSQWFRYVAATSNPLATVETCGLSGSDTVLVVFDSCGGAQIACNDDTCGLQSRVRFAAVAGEDYFIRISAFGAGAAAGQILITEPDPLTSCVTPPPGATSEDEACGDDTNGGCNNPNQSFFELSPGAVTIAGTGWANNNVRDTDWYRLTATSSTRIDATLQADFPAVLFLVTGACANVAVPVVATAPIRCTDIASFTTVVPAGSYVVFVAPSLFNDFPCGLVNNYVLTVNSVAVGACCTPEGCSIKSSAECASIGGNYLGDDSNCSNGSSYNAAETTTTAFEDVQAVGTALALQDDNAQIVDIGFEFSFFGESYTQVSVASNGYLQFGASSSIFVNGAIPNPAAPNNCAYGLWDDLLPPAGGTITVATLGTAPNRRFIAQYQDVAQFGGGTPVTFEMVLYEGSNNIEYVYGNIPEDVAGDFTVGVENADGTVAKSVDTATLGTGNTARRFTPTAPTGGCNPTCAADFDGDGSLTPDDLSDYITAFFSQPPNPRADFNGDGAIDPDDLSDYITAFFAGC